ncbi:MAG: NAD-dependent epimerase/dehydratase family protein [Crocinitomicaceae bacterium]
MVFVTGGTGVLGTHVLLELLSRGEDIRALKRESSDLEQPLRVFQFYLNEKAKSEFNKIEWVNGDLLDIVSLEEGIKGCSAVYHCAATVSFAKRDFNKMWRINKIGTENVVNVCLGQKVEYLCHISSTAAIGKSNKTQPNTEENKWVNNRENSNYAVTKHSAEMEVWRGAAEGLNAVIVNPSVILGPGNWNESSLSIFKVVKRGLKFYTSGMNAFVDVRDVAFIAAELAKRGVFNDRFLVISENLYYKDLFELIAREFDVPPPTIKVKRWMAALAWRVEGFLHFLFGRKQNITKETAKSAMTVTTYSNDKIKSQLNFEFIPIKDAVKNAVRYFTTTTKN